MMQKRDEADSEGDLLNTRVVSLETDILSAESRVKSLQAQLSQNNDELLTSLNDLVALGNLLRNEEQKCKKLTADYRICKKGIQARELKLNTLYAEMDSLRGRLESAVHESLSIRAEKQKCDKKLTILRSRFEAVSRQLPKNETLFNLNSKRNSLYQANAVAVSRILDEMSKRRIRLPVLANPPKFLVAIPGSSARRWNMFSCLLAREGIFDPKGYLALHPDVAALRVDPLVHFLTHGLAEHRALKEGVDQ